MKSRAEYKRKWRAARGAETGRLGRKITEPCGTYAAFRRHQRKGERACPDCQAAYAAYQHKMYVQRKARQG